MEHNIGIWFIIIAMLCLGAAIVIAFVYIFNFIIALLNEVKPKDRTKNNKKYLLLNKVQSI